MTYLTGNEGQKFRTVVSETRARKSPDGLPRSDRSARQKMQRRACIASRMLSSSVVSPRQTLRELARDHE